MSKPILEIRSSEYLSRETYDRIYEQLKSGFPDYDVLLLDSGMSAGVHDDAILRELRQIKEIMARMYKPITGQDLADMMR